MTNIIFLLRASKFRVAPKLVSWEWELLFHKSMRSLIKSYQPTSRTGWLYIYIYVCIYIYIHIVVYTCIHIVAAMQKIHSGEKNLPIMVSGEELGS